MLGADFTLPLELIIPVQKSIKLNGRSTCLRLEKIYWMILKDIAQKEQKSITKLLSNIEMEICTKVGGVKNFSGLVRVACIVHVFEHQVTSHWVNTMPLYTSRR